jgi:hypothetical protein
MNKKDKIMMKVSTNENVVEDGDGYWVTEYFVNGKKTFGNPCFEVGVYNIIKIEEHKWFCTKCHRIFISKSPKCCKSICEPYNPIEHSQYIVGKSNAWIDVWETWKDNPLLKEISYKLHDEGCYSASTILNEFIRELIKDKE